MKSVSDSDVLGALRAADPAAMTELSASDALAAVRRARPASTRRRWTLWAGALAAIVVIGVPVGAVGSGFMARTGWFGSPNPGDDRGTFESTETDGSEILDLGASDLPEVIVSLYPEWMPLAPGVTREDLTARVVAIMTHDNAYGSETLARRTFESESYKDWVGAWITAHESGDSATQERAAAVLLQATEWPAIVATDGGGITDVMRVYAERIAAGDSEAAQALAEGELVPEWDGVNRYELSAEIYDEALGEQE